MMRTTFPAVCWLMTIKILLIVLMVTDAKDTIAFNSTRADNQTTNDHESYIFPTLSPEEQCERNIIIIGLSMVMITIILAVLITFRFVLGHEHIITRKKAVMSPINYEQQANQPPNFLALPTQPPTITPNKESANLLLNDISIIRDPESSSVVAQVNRASSRASSVVQERNPGIILTLTPSDDKQPLTTTQKSPQNLNPNKSSFDHQSITTTTDSDREVDRPLIRATRKNVREYGSQKL